MTQLNLPSRAWILALLFVGLCAGSGCTSSLDRPEITAEPIQGPLELRVEGWELDRGTRLATVEVSCAVPAGLAYSSESPTPALNVELLACDFPERSYDGEGHGYSHGGFVLQDDGRLHCSLSLILPEEGLTRLERFEAEVDLVFFEEVSEVEIPNWSLQTGALWSHTSLPGVSVEFLSYADEFARLRVRAPNVYHAQLDLRLPGVGLKGSREDEGSSSEVWAFRVLEGAKPLSEGAMVIRVSKGPKRYQGRVSARALAPRASRP
tara:strand:+ start:1750 stop:2544 length:795 start_codon:yes stop_codon:yes gene_type:complete